MATSLQQRTIGWQASQPSSPPASPSSAIPRAEVTVRPHRMVVPEHPEECAYGASDLLRDAHIYTPSPQLRDTPHGSLHRVHLDVRCPPCHGPGCVYPWVRTTQQGHLNHPIGRRHHRNTVPLRQPELPGHLSDCPAGSTRNATVTAAPTRHSAATPPRTEARPTAPMSTGNRNVPTAAPALPHAAAKP